MPKMHKTAFPIWNGNDANFINWNKENSVFMEWNGPHSAGLAIRHLKRSYEKFAVKVKTCHYMWYIHSINEMFPSSIKCIWRHIRHTDIYIYIFILSEIQEQCSIRRLNLMATTMATSRAKTMAVAMAMAICRATWTTKTDRGNGTWPG